MCGTWSSKEQTHIVMFWTTTNEQNYIIWQSVTHRIEVIKRQPFSTVSGVSNNYRHTKCVVPDSRLDGRSLIIKRHPANPLQKNP